MYNMDISIFGYKVNLEILILIAIVFLIMMGHTCCGCYNYSLMEGFTDASGNTVDISGNLQEKKENIKEKVQAAKTNNAAQMTAGTSDATADPVTSATTTTTEGFTGANINYGESSLFSLSNDTPVDTSSWSAQNMTVTPGQPLSAGVKAFLARPEQPVPLPEGEMFMFANTKFAPEYCPNTYSNSSGCAAMTGAQYNYLVTRGGNNVPYSEY
jgi:hypothetical protein